MIAWQKERLSSILDIYNKNKFLYNPGSNKTDNRGQGVTSLNGCNAVKKMWLHQLLECN